MNKPRYGQWGAAILAAGLLLVLLFATPTRWLAQTQWGMSCGVGNPFLISPVHPGAAQPHSGDYQLQLVQALDQADAPSQALTVAGQPGVSDSDRRLTALRALEPRFPNTPSLYANILRFAMMRGSWAASEGDWALGSTSKPKGWDKSIHPPSAAQLAAFDADAAQGEKLDPDNAYFPLMRAVGLWTVHRQADALTAVERASTKRAWREYYMDEVEGHWRTNELNMGSTAALNRAAVSASILYPHLARLRSLARAVTYQAVLLEQAGHPQDGMNVRLALMRCGATMQTQAPTQIGSLVGSAIGAIAMARPGGAAPIPSGSTGDEHAQKRLDAFCAYAIRLGRPDAAQEAQQSNRVWRQTRAIFQKAADLSVFGLTPLWQLTRWWTASLVVLANIVLMLACGLFAALAKRLPHSDDGESSEGALVLLHVLFGVGVFLTLALVWTWQARALSPLFALAQALTGGTNTDPYKSARVLSLLGMIAAPLFTLLGAVAVSLIRRQAFFAGVSHAFRAAALPVVCILLLLYGGLILGTARQERTVNTTLTRILQHEGRYMAEVTGQPWPQ